MKKKVWGDWNPHRSTPRTQVKGSRRTKRVKESIKTKSIRYNLVFSKEDLDKIIERLVTGRAALTEIATALRVSKNKLSANLRNHPSIIAFRASNPKGLPTNAWSPKRLFPNDKKNFKRLTENKIKEIVAALWMDSGISPKDERFIPTWNKAIEDVRLKGLRVREEVQEHGTAQRFNNLPKFRVLNLPSSTAMVMSTDVATVEKGLEAVLAELNNGAEEGAGIRPTLVETSETKTETISNGTSTWRRKVIDDFGNEIKDLEAGKSELELSLENANPVAYRYLKKKEDVEQKSPLDLLLEASKAPPIEEFELMPGYKAGDRILVDENVNTYKVARVVKQKSDWAFRQYGYEYLVVYLPKGRHGIKGISETGIWYYTREQAQALGLNFEARDRSRYALSLVTHAEDLGIDKNLTVDRPSRAQRTRKYLEAKNGN